MAFQLNPKSDLLKNTGNFNTVSSPAKLAPLIAAAAGGGGIAAAAGGAAASAGGAAAAAKGGAAAAKGGAAASGLDPSKIMNMAGKSKNKPAKEKEKSKPKFYTEDEDSYYGE